MKKVTENDNEEKANNDHQFIRLFHSVFQKQEFNLLQKYIICYIISFQLQDKEFYMTDAKIAYDCGTSESTVYRNIKKIKPFMDVKHKSTGGKANNRRFLKMKNLKDWIPYEITKDIKIDVTKFKTIPEFMRWANTVFNTNDEIFKFSSYNKQIEKHLQLLNKAA